jgi:hypothetical protein
MVGFLRLQAEEEVNTEYILCIGHVVTDSERVVGGDAC